MIAIAMILIGLGVGLKFLSDRVKKAQEKQREEIEMLREKSMDQEKQLRDVNLKAAELIEKQTQLAQGMLEQKQNASRPIPELNTTLSELAEDMEGLDDEDVAEHVKSWIEKS